MVAQGSPGFGQLTHKFRCLPLIQVSDMGARRRVKADRFGRKTSDMPDQLVGP